MNISQSYYAERTYAQSHRICFKEKQPHGRSVLPRESIGVFHLPVTPTEWLSSDQLFLNSPTRLPWSWFFTPQIVTDFTMERLLTPFSWERERRAKIINAEGEFQAARKNSRRRHR